MKAGPSPFETPACSGLLRVRENQIPPACGGAAGGVRCNADHTACAVAGIDSCSVPIASVMALITAAGEAIAPAPPQPLMPSGLDGEFVSVSPMLNNGRSCARGIV